MDGLVAVIFVIFFAGIVIAITFYFSNAQVSIAELKASGHIPEIIAIYQDERARQSRRSEALAALAEIGTPETFKALTAMLDRTDDDLFDNLAAALARTGPPIYPYLAESFRKSASRAGVVRVMRKAGPAQSEWILPFLKDSSADLRNNAVQALDRCGWKPGKDQNGAAYWIARRRLGECAAIGSPAVPELIEALRNPELAGAAIQALGQIGDLQAGQPLLNKGREEPYAALVIDAIGSWKASALPLLMGALSSVDERIRQLAGDILEYLHWQPGPDENGARYWLLKRRWDKCIEIGAPALEPLLEELRGKGQAGRLDLIRALGALGQPRGLEAILPLLSDPELGIRLAVVEALGHFSDLRAIQALVQTLEQDPLYPLNVEALVKIGPPASAELAAFMANATPKGRSRAAEALDKSGWLPQTDPEKALFSIARQDWQTLAQLGSSAGDYLVRELDNPQNCTSAAQALVNIGDRRAAPAILKAMHGKPAELQLALAQTLKEAGPEAVDPLLEGLETGQLSLIPAITALGKTADRRAAARLAECLTYDSPLPVRRAAAEALGEIGTPAVEPILAALDGENIEPSAAGQALGLAGKDSLPRLIEALNSREYDIQVLIYALAKIPEPESAAAILSILPGGQYGQQIRNTAFEALVGIGRPAIQPLINALAQYPGEQAVFAPILVAMGGEAVDPLLATLRSTFTNKQREAIIDILGDIGDHRALYPLFDSLGKFSQHRNHINEALAKIRKHTSR